MKGMSGEEKSEGKESLGGKEREKSEGRKKMGYRKKGAFRRVQAECKIWKIESITNESGKGISKKKNRVGKRWRNGSGQVLRKATSQ